MFYILNTKLGQDVGWTNFSFGWYRKKNNIVEIECFGNNFNMPAGLEYQTVFTLPKNCAPSREIYVVGEDFKDGALLTFVVRAYNNAQYPAQIQVRKFTYDQKAAYLLGRITYVLD